MNIAGTDGTTQSHLNRVITLYSAVIMNYASIRMMMFNLGFNLCIINDEAKSINLINLFPDYPIITFMISRQGINLHCVVAEFPITEWKEE